MAVLAAQIVTDGVEQPPVRQRVVLERRGYAAVDRSRLAANSSYQPTIDCGAGEQHLPRRGAIAVGGVVALPEIEHGVAGESQAARRR